MSNSLESMRRQPPLVLPEANQRWQRPTRGPLSEKIHKAAGYRRGFLSNEPRRRGPRNNDAPAPRIPRYLSEIEASRLRLSFEPPVLPTETADLGAEATIGSAAAASAGARVSGGGDVDTGSVSSDELEYEVGAGASGSAGRVQSHSAAAAATVDARASDEASVLGAPSTMQAAASYDRLVSLGSPEFVSDVDLTPLDDKLEQLSTPLEKDAEVIRADLDALLHFFQTNASDTERFKGMDINAFYKHLNQSHDALLHTVALAGEPDMFKLLLHLKENGNGREFDAEYRTVPQAIAMQGVHVTSAHVECIALVASVSADAINWVGPERPDGREPVGAPVALAARNGATAAVRAFLELGADPNARVGEDTALAACVKGPFCYDVEAKIVLKEYGPQRLKARKEISRLLLAHQHIDKHALSSGEPAFTALVKLDPYARNKFAAMERSQLIDQGIAHVNLLGVFLKCAVDPNVPDADGHTSIWHAARNNPTRGIGVSRLKRKESPTDILADPNAKGPGGESALEYAMTDACPTQTLTFLLRHRQKFDRVDVTDAFHMGLEQEHPNIEKLQMLVTQGRVQVSPESDGSKNILSCILRFKAGEDRRQTKAIQLELWDAIFSNYGLKTTRPIFILRPGFSLQDLLDEPDETRLGFRPIHVLTEQGGTEFLKRLVDLGVSVKGVLCRNGNGEFMDVLGLAEVSGRKEPFKQLLRNAAKRQ